MITDAGVEFQANVMGNPAANGAGAYAPASYIGVSASTTLPSRTDTTLPGEITTGSLVRAQATFAYTAGARSYTLSRVFVSDQEIELAKIGVFNQVTAGIMVFEELWTTKASLVPGDQVLVSHTVDLVPAP